MKITILGCGGSGGVPMIGNNWGACNPANPKNRRTRVSIVVEEGDTRLLVDCGPDLREQFLKNNIDRVDHVLMTHPHADHLVGIDDLRRTYWLTNKYHQMGFYSDQATMQEVESRFPYVFHPFRYGAGEQEPFVRHIVAPGDELKFGSIKVRMFEQKHREITTMGYRFNDFAYTTDANHLDEHAFKALEGVTHWVVDCERYEPHSAHSHFDQTISWIKRVAPKQAWLTHMGAHIDYDEVLAKCPPGVEPAYDGLVIQI